MQQSWLLLSIINMTLIFLHLDILKVVAFVHQLTEFYNPDVSFKYQHPRILLIVMNFQLSLVPNLKKTGQNYQLSKMTEQLLHYLITPSFLYSLKEIKKLCKF